MSFELLSEENREIIFPAELTSAHQKFLVPGSNRICAAGSFGTLLFQDFGGPDFQIHFSNYLLKEKAAFTCRSEVSLLELQFCLHNTTEYDLATLGKMAMKKFHYNLTYAPFTENKVKFEPRRYTTFDVHYSIEFLVRIEDDFPALARFLQRIDQGEGSQIVAQCRMATPEMLGIIQELSQLKDSPTREFLMEGYVKHLLIMALLGMEKPFSPPGWHPTASDIESLHEVRKMLLGDLDKPTSIRLLSRKVGLNEFKLKKGYREVFGTTMFADLREARMNRSLELLRQNDKSLGQISHEVGFHNMTNFSVAFRKKFGCPPNYWRRTS